MPLPNTIVPTYPNVPRAPGVPPVLRQVGGIINTGVLLAADAISILRLFQGPQWGIFDEGGQPLFEDANVIRVEFREGWRVSDYPLEKGAFESYNKVKVPFSARVVLGLGASVIPGLPNLPGIPGTSLAGGIGGSELARRTAFLAAIQAAAASLDLYTLVQPEARYPSSNIVEYDYDRSALRSATMLLVNIKLDEIRVTATTQFSETNPITSPKTPTSASPQNGGQVQPSVPTIEQSAAAPATFI